MTACLILVSCNNKDALTSRIEKDIELYNSMDLYEWWMQDNEIVSMDGITFEIVRVPRMANTMDDEDAHICIDIVDGVADYAKNETAKLYCDKLKETLKNNSMVIEIVMSYDLIIVYIKSREDQILSEEQWKALEEQEI